MLEELSFGERLSILRVRKGLNRKQLATLVNKSDPVVTNWEQGKNSPDKETIMKLASILGTSTDVLLGVQKSQLVLPRGAEPMPETHALPVLGKAAANAHAIFVEAKETEIVDVRYSKKDHYCLKVIGRSMAPTMYEGDTLVVQVHPLALAEYDEFNGPANPKPWLALHKKVVVASVNGEDATVKRILVYGRKETGFKIILSPDNRSADTIEIEREHNLRVLGVVKVIMRDPSNFE